MYTPNLFWYSPAGHNIHKDKIVKKLKLRMRIQCLLSSIEAEIICLRLADI